MAATLFGPSAIVLVGRHDSRLELGRKAGATHVVNSKNTDAVAFVKELTGGRGATSIIDTVANKTSLSQALEVAQAGAWISVIGFGHLYAPVDAPYTASLFRNLHIHTGVVLLGAHVHRLLPLVERGRIDPSIIFTDLLPLAEATPTQLPQPRAGQKWRHLRPVQQKRLPWPFRFQRFPL